MPDDLETQLAALIDPWLEHMRWRHDFQRWRERRLFQERYQEEHLVAIREVLGEVKGRRVLDIGAGMGGFSVALAREGAHVTALEFNSAYCQIVRLRGRRYGLEMAVVQSPGEALPFPAESFDLLCSWDVLEHVQDPLRVLQEAGRVLRPGGGFILTAINRRAFKDPHYHLPWINWLPRRWGEAWIRRAARSKESSAFADRQSLSEMHYFTWAAFCRLAAESGFRVVDLQEKRLRAGTLSASRKWRRRLRAFLHTVGLELPAYRVARSLFLPFFEVVLWKE